MEHKSKISRLLAILLTVIVVLAMMPGTAFAAAPGISNAELSPTNSRVTIDFTEGVYGNAEHTLPVATDDFTLTFEQNGGAVSNVALASIRTQVNGDPAGGETRLLFYLSLTSGPASGTETIVISLADGTSVYNASGEALAASETTGLITLHDVAPTFPTGFPKEGSEQAAGSKRLSLQTGGLSEPSTVYYVVLADGAALPSAAQVQAGQDAAGNQTFFGPLNLRTPPDNPDIAIVEAAVNALTFDIIKVDNTAQNNVVSNLNLATAGISGTVPVTISSGRKIE
ncbi:MAG TPA: hypothetical protein VEA58_07640 [Anaerovoracaceae bacterium]|nr:hypothetical protein [Anaerovoracaceae bacterium]